MPAAIVPADANDGSVIAARREAANRVSRSLSGNIIVNVGFAAITAVGVICLMRLSTSVLAPAELALFLAARRYSASISSLTNLGGPLFQIRYMGMHPDDERLGELITLFVTAVFTLVSMALVLAVFFAGHFIAGTILPASSYPSWFLGILVMLSIQQLFFFSVHNHLLVRRRIVVYNVYKFLAATGLLFPAILLAAQHSARSVLTAYLVLSAGLLAVGHGMATIRPLLDWRRLPWSRLPWIVREAASYGPPRAFVNFIDSLLLVLPVWLLRGDVVEAGFMLSMFVFIQATSVVILPINELVMVASAANLGAGHTDGMQRMTTVLFKLLLVVSCALVASVIPFREALYRTAIGSERVVVGVSAYSALLSCIIPITVFGGLKGVIDMQWKRPWNLANLCVSQVGSVALFYLLRIEYGWDARSAVIMSCATGLWALGIATVLAVRSLLRRIDWPALGAALAVVVGAAVAQTVLARWLARMGTPWIVQFVVMSIGSGVCALAAARLADKPAWDATWSRVRRGRLQAVTPGATEEG
jgi:hypothetical protein